jgi:hypothetical protein
MRTRTRVSLGKGVVVITNSLLNDTRQQNVNRRGNESGRRRNISTQATVARLVEIHNRDAESLAKQECFPKRSSNDYFKPSN